MNPTGARFAIPSRAGLLLFLSAYLAVALLLLNHIPPTLDEIIDLNTIRKNSWSELFASVPWNTGGVPLGYAVRKILMNAFGESVFFSRFPSVIASILSCVGVFVLGKWAGLQKPLLAVALFAALPLQFRHALEGRAYALGLCFSIWATVIFLRMLETRALHWLLTYFVLIAAGLYAQPFSIFIPIAHGVWLLSYCPAEYKAHRVRLATFVAAAGAAACLAFLPWVFFASRIGMDPGHNARSSLDWSAIQLVVKEFTGAGYVGTAFIAAPIFLAWRRARSSSAPNHGSFLGVRPNLQFWLICIAVPIIGALLVDAVSGYFLAIRQMIFALAPLAILCAAAIDSLSSSLVVCVLAVATFVAFLVANVVFFTIRPHEDFRSAAAALADERCVIFSPPESRQLFAYFRPDLQTRACDEPAPERVAVAVSPYGSSGDQVTASLASEGYEQSQEMNFDGPQVVIYLRPPTPESPR